MDKKTPSDVIGARTLIQKILTDSQLPEHIRLQLEEIPSMLTRRSGKRGPRRKAYINPDMAEAIRQVAAEEPGLHQDEIAVMFDTNHGRVSEALNYQR